MANNGNLFSLREAIRLTIESIPYWNYYYGKIQDINNAPENEYLANLLPVTATVQLSANETMLKTYSIQIVFSKIIDFDNNTEIQADWLNEIETAVDMFIDLFNTNYQEYILSNISWLEDGSWNKTKNTVSAILLRMNVVSAFDYNC